MAAWQYYPLLPIFLVGGFVSLGVTLYSLWHVRTRGRSYLAGSVGLFAFSNAIWVVAATLKVASPSLEMSLLFYKLEYVGSAAMPSLAVVLALTYVGYESWCSRKLVGVLGTIYVVSATLILVNPGGLMIANPTFVEAAGIQAFEHDFPPLFVAYLAWALGAGLVAGLFVVRGALRTRVDRTPALLVAFTFFLPVLVVAVKVLGIYPPGGKGVSVTPAANAIASGLLAIAVFEYRLFELVPVGRDRALNVMHEGYVIVDREGTIVDTNPAARTLLTGIEDTTLETESVTAYVPDFDEIEDGTTTFTRDDRVIKALCSRITRRGELAGHVLILLDVTEEQERTRELERKERIIENVPVGVYRTTPGPEGEAEFVNQTLVEMLGADSKDDLGEYTVSDMYVDPDERAAFSEQLLQSGQLTGREIQMRTLDGEEFCALISDARVERDGETYFEGAVQDITKRKEQEARLEKQRDDLDLLNQVLRHDIRNHLQLVWAYADMLDEYTVDDGQEYLAKVKNGADNAVALTEVAKEMSDVMLSQTSENVPVALAPVLNQQIEEIRSAQDNVVLRVETTIPEVDVRANSMLGSIFRNLLTNAIQHNDKPVPELTVSVGESSEVVTVRIADNGSGVADSEKDVIFGRGEKGLDSPGSGIGLYLVETLVESYDGQVRVEDNDPEGAIFVVELPVLS